MLSIQILNSLRRKKWDYRLVSHLHVFRMLFLEVVLPSSRFSNLALNIHLEDVRSGGMLIHTCLHTYVSLCACVGICIFAYV